MSVKEQYRIMIETVEYNASFNFIKELHLEVDNSTRILMEGIDPYNNPVISKVFLFSTEINNKWRRYYKARGALLAVLNSIEGKRELLCTNVQQRLLNVGVCYTLDYIREVLDKLNEEEINRYLISNPRLAIFKMNQKISKIKHELYEVLKYKVGYIDIFKTLPVIYRYIIKLVPILIVELPPPKRVVPKDYSIFCITLILNNFRYI